jgi:hypothetical protein
VGQIEEAGCWARSTGVVFRLGTISVWDGGLQGSGDCLESGPGKPLNPGYSVGQASSLSSPKLEACPTGRVNNPG